MSGFRGPRGIGKNTQSIRQPGRRKALAQSSAAAQNATSKTRCPADLAERAWRQDESWRNPCVRHHERAPGSAGRAVPRRGRRRRRVDSRRSRRHQGHRQIDGPPYAHRAILPKPGGGRYTDFRETCRTIAVARAGGSPKSPASGPRFALRGVAARDAARVLARSVGVRRRAQSAAAGAAGGLRGPPWSRLNADSAAQFSRRFEIASTANQDHRTSVLVGAKCAAYLSLLLDEFHTAAEESAAVARRSAVRRDQASSAIARSGFKR